MLVSEFRVAPQALYCYSLDALDVSNSNRVHIPQKLTGSIPVDFFRVGIWSNSLVVVYKRKRIVSLAMTGGTCAYWNGPD